MTSPRPLSAEVDALQTILSRLMSEEVSIDNLCKHVPRIASVSANVARIQAGLEASKPSELMDELTKALLELHDEAENDDDQDETGDEAIGW